MTTVELLFISVCCLIGSARAADEGAKMTIGVIYQEEDWLDPSQIKNLFSLAIERYGAGPSKHKEGNRVPVDFKTEDVINSSGMNDVWKLVNKTCSLLSQGVTVVMSYGNVFSYPTIKSMTNDLNISYINLNLPPKAFSIGNVTRGNNHRPRSPNLVRVAVPSGDGNDLDISMKPPLYKVLGDIIVDKGWHLPDSNVTYVYDFPDSLLNVERLTSYVSQIEIKRLNTSTHKKINPFRIELLQLDFYRPYSFFKQLHMMRSFGLQRVVLDISFMDTNNQRRIIKQLQNAAAKCRNFHYLIGSYEFNADDLKKFEDDLINVTGLSLFSNDNAVYREMKSFQATGDITPEAAFAFDSVTVAAEGLWRMKSQMGSSYQLDNSSPATKSSTETSACSEGFARDFGLDLTRSMKEVKIDGLSGRVQFNDEGIRTNYTFGVVELSFSSDTNVMVAVSSNTESKWNEVTGFTDFSKQKLERFMPREGPHNKTWRITTVGMDPFVMDRPAKDGKNFTGNDRYEGYCIDLIHKIADVLNKGESKFNYEIQLVKDKKFGNVGENGEWNGMLGEMLRGEADLAVASLVITKARERVVDFSKPFMTLGISIMIKKPDKQEFSVFSFMSPLSTEIWMYIVFAYVGVSVVIFLVSRFSPYEWRIDETPAGGFTISNDFSVYNCLWFTLAAFMQQGTDILPRSISGRVASSAWWFFTMIIVSSYTANLAAFLTLEKMQTPIKSVEDLAKQTKIKYGIQGGGSTAEFFRDSSVETYKRMWQFMSSQVPSVFVKTYAEGIKRVRDSKGRYAFLLESSANAFTNTRIPCDTMQVGHNLNSIGYGIATPFGSELKDKLNLAILELQERGELKRLELKWWNDRGQCDQGRQDGHSASLNLSKVAGIFYILIAGMVVSMLCALGEFLYRSRIEARKGEKSLSSSMRAQLDVSLYGEKDVASKSRLLQAPSNSSLDPVLRDEIAASYNTAV